MKLLNFLSNVNEVNEVYEDEERKKNVRKNKMTTRLKHDDLII